MSVDVEYVDSSDAIKRVGGNRGLYIKLLNQFVGGGYADALVSSLDAGDLETAARDAHSLKGVCANLSLRKLNACALELEQKLKGNEEYQASLDTLKEVYGSTLQQIEEFCAEG